MSDDVQLKLQETCWCGAEVSAEGNSWEALTEWVARWRCDHHHELPRRSDTVGFAATQTARDTSWPAFYNRPVG